MVVKAAWVGVVAVVAAALLVTGTLSGTERAPRSASSQPSVGAKVAAVDKSWCDHRHERLRCIADEAGLRAVVYRGNPASKDLVFWDPGGPGLGLPDADASLDILVPRSVKHQNLLLVVEPWVRRPPSAACARGSFDATPGPVCALETLATTPQSIRTAVDLAERRTGMKMVGAYLQSFGATRSVPALVGVRGVRWIVLESPGPVPGADAGRLIRARVGALRDLLADSCDSAGCNERVRAAVGRFGKSGAVKTSGRELALGLIAAATLPDQNHRFLATVARELDAGVVAERTAVRLRFLGRLYEGKRPGAVISPSVIALWADTCPRLTGWRDLARARDALLSAYSWTFRGCLSSVWGSSPAVERVAHLSVPVLMLTGRRDPVVPPSVQRGWLRLGESVRVIAGRGHFWEDSSVVLQVRRWIAEKG